MVGQKGEPGGAFSPPLHMLNYALEIPVPGPSSPKLWLLGLARFFKDTENMAHFMFANQFDHKVLSSFHLSMK